jgi:hypothetical protein
MCDVHEGHLIQRLKEWIGRDGQDGNRAKQCKAKPSSKAFNIPINIALNIAIDDLVNTMAQKL